MTADAQAYLDLSAMEILRRVRITPRHATEGTYAGPFTSRYRGTSVEFADYRNYIDGDDIRLVDWKVFARRDRYYIKLYEAERNFVAHIVADTSASMGFSGVISQTDSKQTHASRLAAALGYLVLRDGNALGLALGGSQITHYERPSNQWNHFNYLLETLTSQPAAGETDLSTLLEELFPRIRSRGVLMIISDFFSVDDKWWQMVDLYRKSRFDVMLFQVIHPEELDLPPVPYGRFIDMEKSSRRFKVDIDSIRDTYQQKMVRFLDAMGEHAAIRGCDHFLARTDQDPYRFLKRCFL